MDQVFDKMSNSEAVLAPYYVGDITAIAKNNPNVGVVVPKSGTNRFIDSLCIPKSSKHKKEAEQYINFMCRTDVALANISYISYSSPQAEVMQILKNNGKYAHYLYPDEKIIKNSQIFLHLPENINNLVDSLWIEVKAGKESNTMLFVGVIFIFILTYVGVLVYKRRKAGSKTKKLYF
jgi:spermidine/putrescine transport system substrate-binding protein